MARKTTKQKLEEETKKLELLTKKYEEEVKSKAHNIFVKNKIEYLLDDDSYVKMIEDIIIKSSNDFIAHGRQNENV